MSNRRRSSSIVVAMALLLSVCTGCAVMRWTTGVTRDYDYWGHLVVGDAMQEDNTTVIPIEHNGQDGELWMDSGQTIWDVPFEVEDDQIFFSIRTCMASAASSKRPPMAIRVSDLTPGVYRVAYRGPENVVHELGKVTVPIGASTATPVDATE